MSIELLPLAKAFGSTALISILPTIILPFVPVDRSNLNSCLHRVLLAFAAGGMLGDVFLHLLPHLLNPHSHAHGHGADGPEPVSHHSQNHGHRELHGNEELHEHSDTRDHSDDPHSHSCEEHHQHGHEHSLSEQDDSHSHSCEEHHHDNDHHSLSNGHTDQDASHSHSSEEHHHHDHDRHSLSNGHTDQLHHSHGHGLDFDNHGHITHDHDRKLLAKDFHRSHGHHHMGEAHGRDESAAIWIGLFVMLGFTVFFIADKLLRSRQGGHSHCHGHHHTKDKSSDDDHSKEDKTHSDKDGLRHRTKGKEPSQAPPAGSKDESKDAAGPLSRLGAGGWLNLAADMMHNATDGLAIGVSFASGHGLGVATTISTLAHELPHEIGDYAVLIKNGLSKKEAILAQFCTAVGAIIGTAVGLVAHSFEELQPLMLGFTAGGFVYVACVSVIPEILETASSPGQIIMESIGIGLGVGLMVIVALYE